MTSQPLYEFDEKVRARLIRLELENRYTARVTGPCRGAFGEIYRIGKGPLRGQRELVAKCPRISRFGSREKAAAGLEEVLHEAEKTYRLLASPWVNRFIDIHLIYGWPFLISRCCDGTLGDLIANPLVWSEVDQLASLIQIVRALRLAALRGISAHQDLKPQNVFFDDIHRKYPAAVGVSGLHFQMRVGDFGNADAFQELGRNSGSRPYMAPEQFQSDTLNPSVGRAFDIFALGVIGHECFCDGYHPIGTVTSDVWPWTDAVPRKWDRARVWRKWAENPKKDLSMLGEHCPEPLFSALSKALSADPERRPSLEELEDCLWKTLHDVHDKAASGIRSQIENQESHFTDDDWPFFKDRLSELRTFYARRG
ncbi:protein kinase [Maritimibacter sp. 55A14]|uniref:protein kinase domain-containing protein n=1 Tax=Maritimibacter sp. 55A14 TaxID=2174844 RepID=UPI0013048706|nr:protein kinase [Maritimibacter sp. 55A14]